MRTLVSRTVLVGTAVLLVLGAIVAVDAASDARGTVRRNVGPAGVSIDKIPFDEQYIDILAMHHESAIAMSRMALRRAKHEKLRELAREMIAAQRAERRSLREWRERWYGEGMFREYALSEREQRMLGMTPRMRRMLKEAYDFDHAFVDMIIPHHAGALTLSRWAADEADHRTLRELAEDVIAAQGEEIGVFTLLHRRWFGID
jgi:uncharacterized protein (DUF305 family)